MKGPDLRLLSETLRSPPVPFAQGALGQSQSAGGGEEEEQPDREQSVFPLLLGSDEVGECFPSALRALSTGVSLLPVDQRYDFVWRPGGRGSGHIKWVDPH
ncbi:unnamed protein product [Merluccius merluccius]